ncbi:winged helix-turn-helix transcriptional regulator [Flavobacterium selenitireducens]|uniref:winged helix-turn-helix transcriptional regulator n=1 Tax=Flavobacterium selenitireducens TaxID=2722704 RepID=UPI00168AB4F1|nr:helix-turn-helix domain-containing protein [Flavobacterium selenitireducens]MBD3582625.1 helix-turn-helix transcriptional regulator [Flavobacterium selenitireducens]
MSLKTLPSPTLTATECTQALMHVRDALEILSGKWKLPILIALSTGEMRFRQIATEVNGITDKMLSKELKDLEINQLVTRTVLDTFPPTVIYARTEHADTLSDVIAALRKWGYLHRQKIING